MIRLCLAVGLILCSLPSTVLGAADPASAERLFRVARRLASSDVPEARAAYEKVVALDPEGVWADDALVEIVLLEGIPQDPAEFGRIDGKLRDRWLTWLDQVQGPLAKGDRAREARRLRASLRLAPLPGRDIRGARFDLLELVEENSDDAEAAYARVWLGWLAMMDGRLQNAEDAWSRVLVDAQDVGASRLAVRGLQQLTAFQGRPLAALEWFSRGKALAGGGEDAAQLAWRMWNRLHGKPLVWRASSSGPIREGLRGNVKIAFDTKGVLWTGIARDRIVERTDGKADVQSWVISGLVGLCVDPLGRGYVATDREIVRLVDGGRRTLAALEEYASPRAIAADIHGDLWVLDRRGTRLGRVTEAGTIETVWEDRKARLGGLAVTIEGPLAIDSKTGSLLRFDRDGSLRGTTVTSARPTILVVDPAGSTYTLDTRLRRVEVRSRDGNVREAIDLSSLGAVKPEGLAVAADGSLIVYDADAGIVRRYR